MTHALTTQSNALALAGPVGSLDSYIQTVSSIPVLSREDEQALAVRYREHDDLEAARTLVMSNLRFVVHVARGYSGYGLAIGDLIQEGNIGLMKAVKRFDPKVGVRLVSFAVHWIRAEIHEFVLRNWRVVKIATTKAQRKLFFNLRKSKKRLGWLSASETEAVAKDLGVSTSEVTRMEQRLSAWDAAYDAPIGADEERAYAPALYLPSPNADPAAAVEADEWEHETSNQLASALETLDARSRDILQQRWLGETRTTLRELAEEYGVSAERIRQIEANALKKMRGVIDLGGGAVSH